MGQVFTWEDVSKGQIPKLESFHRMTEAIRERFVREPSIVTALLFGSVVRGDFNIRSDIDCVVIYDRQREMVAMDVMHQADAAARALHVPLSLTTCDTVLARTRLHTFGTAFIRHLQAAIDAGGLIKGSLADLAPTVPAAQEIESYISQKMYSLHRSRLRRRPPSARNERQVF